MCEESGLQAEARIDGSVAKDTWLRGEADIDIFFRIPTDKDRTFLEEDCLNIARKAVKGFRVVERYADHPYIEAWVDGFRVNIVPCYKTERGSWLSATDRTPFHTEYMKEKLEDETRNQIRLLKKFMKGTRVYGAEVKVGGFSGFLCEVLTLNYGSFEEAVKNAVAWKKGELVDLEAYYVDRLDEVHDLFPEPLIVIDPIDKGRNAAAAVREDRMWEFVSACRMFLREPTINYFDPHSRKPRTKAQIKRDLKSRGTNLVFVAFPRVEAVVDVLWGQLHRTENSIRNLLRKNDFQVIRSGAWSDEDNLNVLVFEVESARLPPLKKHYGPPVSRSRESEKFLEKHAGARDTVSGPWIEEGKWVVEKARAIRDVRNFLLERLGDGGRSVGVASRIAKSMRKRVRVFLDDEVLQGRLSDRPFLAYLDEFLRGRPPWIAA